MAYQPEEEADEVFVFQQRDDHQPHVDFGDIDKGHLIKGEPTQLIEVVDKAVEMARNYMHAPDLLTKMINDIETYLERKTMSQLTADPDIPYEVWEPLEMLIRHTESYYNGSLGSDRAREPIRKLLGQFCQKVKDIRGGCLIAELILKDDLQLAQLVQKLDYIAGQVKHILVEEGVIQKQVAAIVSTKRIDLSPKMREMLPELFSKLHDLARIQVSIPQQKMLDFLEGLPEENSVELTILPLLGVRRRTVVDESAKGRRKKFIEQLQLNELVFKALEQVFSDVEETQQSMKLMKLQEQTTLGVAKTKEFDEPQKGLDVRPKLTGKKGIEAEKEEARLEMARTEELEKSAADSDVLPTSSPDICTLYVNDLFDGTKVKELFNEFKEFGTILYVSIGRKPRNYRGSVCFASRSYAEEAIRVLRPKGRDVHILDNPEPFQTDTIELRDLPPNTDQSYLRTACEKYGTIEYIRISHKTSAGYVQFQDASAAFNALSELQASGQFVFMAKLSEETEMDAEKAKARLEMARTEELEKSAADSDVLPKSSPDICTLYVNDLFDGTKVKDLFNEFKEFGTILYVSIGRKPRNYRGYVRFASKLCAEEAIRVLQPKGRDVHISNRAEPAHEKRTTDTIEFRDLPPNTDQSYLRTACEKYGTISRIARGVSSGYVEFQDASAASNALSELQASGEFVFMAKPPRQSY